MKKQKRKIIVLLISLFIFVLVLIAALPAYYLFIHRGDDEAEKTISKEFHTDVQQYPDVKVKRFALWEGDSMADLEIAGKGPVSMWYGVDKIPRIESIEKYRTSFDCFYVDSNGNKTGYAYTEGLNLSDKIPQWKKWFPFRVNSLNDLIARYNEIVHILDGFPKDPTLVDFTDNFGIMKVRKVSDPSFMLITPLGKTPTVCDLYFLTRSL